MMNAVSQILPTVEQINLEYRLSQSKAGEAVQHAITCGLMLLQVKASLAHGQWLPWLKAQQEAGAVEFTERTASKYMRVASNRNRGSDLEHSPSIRAALELLTEDKPDQPALAIDTADSEAAIREAEDAKGALEAALRDKNTALAEARKREEEWREQAIAKEKALKAEKDANVIKSKELFSLRAEIDKAADRMANAKLAGIKADLEKARIDKAEAEAKLKDKTKAMAEQIAQGVKLGLQAQQDEINRREAQLQAIEGRIATLNARLDAVNEQDQAVAHFDRQAKEIRKSMDAISLHLTHAFDQDFAKFLPEPFLPVFERLASELLTAADDIRKALGYVEVRALEVSVHE